MLETVLILAIAITVVAVTGIIPWGAICLAVLVGTVLYCDKK